MAKELMWYGYLGKDGRLHVKRYITAKDLEDAAEKASVEKVSPVFSADNETAAERLLIRILGYTRN